MHVFELKFPEKESEFVVEHKENAKSQYAQSYVEDDTLENIEIHIFYDIELVNPTIELVDDNECQTVITVLRIYSTRKVVAKYYEVKDLL